jgi:hypothetical protein
MTNFHPVPIIEIMTKTESNLLTPLTLKIELVPLINVTVPGTTPVRGVAPGDMPLLMILEHVVMMDRKPPNSLHFHIHHFLHSQDLKLVTEPLMLLKGLLDNDHSASMFFGFSGLIIGLTHFLPFQ